MVYEMCKANLWSPTVLHVFDLSSIGAPAPRGSVALSRVGYAPNLMSVTQQGPRRFVYAYAAAGDEEDLVTIEVTNPQAPVETSVLPIRFGTVHYQALDLDVDGTTGWLYAIGPTGWNPRRWFYVVELNLANAAAPSLEALHPVPRLPDR